MTTQKHDYISKFQYRRLKILPKDNIKKLDGCIEKETTQRLSFMPNCKVERRKSFKPSVIYKKSDGNILLFIFFILIYKFKLKKKYLKFQFQWSFKQLKN